MKKHRIISLLLAISICLTVFTIGVSAGEISFVSDKTVIWSYANLRNGPGENDYSSYGYVYYGDTVHTYKKTNIADNQGRYWCLSKVTATTGSLLGYYGYIVGPAIGVYS